MALHTSASSTIAKRLWGVLRVTFFMIRKGLMSKRKFIMDMNMMMKRGKLWRKTLTNLMFHHHHRHVAARGGYGIQEYEFSCSNSPNPVFFRALKRKHARNYFPCINPPEVIEEEEGEDDSKEFMSMLVPKTPDQGYTFRYLHGADNLVVDQEKLSPSVPFSPSSVGVSNYSSEDESDDGGERNARRVDDAAEEFIRRFYEQLRTQSRTHLLQYQEDN